MSDRYVVSRTAVTCLFLLILVSTSRPTAAQRTDVNYDEAAVPEYVLPDLLKTDDGVQITTPQQWWEKRRPEILEHFTTQVYGRSPDRPEGLRFESLSTDRTALGGRATRKQIRIHLSEEPAAPAIDVLLYVPNERTGPTPIFLGLNFNGNHTVHADPGILLPRPFTNADGETVTADEADRGKSSSRWSIDSMIDRGYGLATAWYYDIDPDFDDGFQNGVHALYLDEDERPADDEWGSIAAWSWGISRIMDYLETDDDLDEEHIALMGHSRLGKAALWAGATDPRFNFVISNNSGEGGAAITRRRFGETITHINSGFPHWFATNFKKYNGKEDDLPVDQHMLIALIAPRSVYVTSAEDDPWADPKGEFLSALHASPVYELLTGSGISVTEMPPVEKPAYGRVSYHIRRGEHDVTDYDWQRWMDWMDSVH